MASDLKQFMFKRTKNRETKDIPVVLKNGDQAEITIQALLSHEFKNAYSRNIKTYPPAEGTSVSTTALDEFDFCADVCIAGIASPDLGNATLQNNFQVMTKKDLIYQLFDFDEIGRIAGEITGLGKQPTTTGTEPDLIKEAKN